MRLLTHVKYSTLVNREQFDRDPDMIHFSNGYYNGTEGRSIFKEFSISI
jgi:phage/plasmid-associated DNA primase